MLQTLLRRCSEHKTAPEGANVCVANSHYEQPCLFCHSGNARNLKSASNGLKKTNGTILLIITSLNFHDHNRPWRHTNTLHSDKANNTPPHMWKHTIHGGEFVNLVKAFTEICTVSKLLLPVDWQFHILPLLHQAAHVDVYCIRHCSVVYQYSALQ